MILCVYLCRVSLCVCECVSVCVSMFWAFFFVCVIRVNVFSVWVCPCLYVETHSCIFLEIFEDAYWYLYVCACVSLCLWFPWCICECLCVCVLCVHVSRSLGVCYGLCVYLCVSYIWVLGSM